MWMINRGKTSKQANKQSDKKGNEKFIVWHIYDEMWYTYTSAVLRNNNNKPLECLSRGWVAGDDVEEKNCDVTQQIRSRFFIFNHFFFFFIVYAIISNEATLLCFPRCHAKNKSHSKTFVSYFCLANCDKFLVKIRKTKQQQRIAIWIRITNKYAAVLFLCKRILAYRSAEFAFCIGTTNKMDAKTANESVFYSSHVNVDVTCCHVYIYFYTESMYNKHFAHRSMTWVKGKWIQINKACTKLLWSWSLSIGPVKCL